MAKELVQGKVYVLDESKTSQYPKNKYVMFRDILPIEGFDVKFYGVVKDYNNQPISNVLCEIDILPSKKLIIGSTTTNNDGYWEIIVTHDDIKNTEWSGETNAKAYFYKNGYEKTELNFDFKNYNNNVKNLSFIINEPEKDYLTLNKLGGTYTLFFDTDGYLNNLNDICVVFNGVPSVPVNNYNPETKIACSIAVNGMEITMNGDTLYVNNSNDNNETIGLKEGDMAYCFAYNKQDIKGTWYLIGGFEIVQLYNDENKQLLNCKYYNN